MTRLLHIAIDERDERIWIDPFIAALREIGELEVVENARGRPEEEIAAMIRGCNVLIGGWGAMPVPAEIAADQGELKYICNVTGSVRRGVPPEIIDAGIPVTNWGDAPAGRVAEAALTLLLAVLKDLPERRRIIREGGWKPDGQIRSGLMQGLKVGCYGCGVIGRSFIATIKPLGPEISGFDPYALDLPEGVKRVGSLADLFRDSEVVALHAALNDETRGSVTAELLALLPDDGILINTARGALLDQDALFRELESGRIRAGLDVLCAEPGESEAPPPDHPARGWPNLILTSHSLAKPYPPSKRLLGMHRQCLANLRNFVEDRPLEFPIDRTRYDRST